MIGAGDSLQGESGSYRIEQVLRAAGQMLTARAVVQEGDQPGQSVVLKQLHIDGVESWKALELFERETAVLRLLDHDHLPRLIDAFARDDESGSSLYLVCSWAEGESLLDKLDAGWKPDEAEIWDIARQSLELLDYLHHFNPPVIHRDLKPGNLIITSDGQVSLVDLGSVQGCLNPDGGSTVVGTFGYMPPEQFSDRCVPASDLYALGATLIHLLTDTFPSDLPRKGMKLDYESLLSCHPAYRAWMDMLLDPIVEKRYQSAAEALNAFEDAREQAGSGKSTSLVVGRHKQERIQTLTRGTGLKILIQPPNLVRGLGLPALAGALLMGWNLLEYNQAVNLYFFGPNYLSEMMPEVNPFTAVMQKLVLEQLHHLLMIGYGAWLVLIRAAYARMHTSIQLQPDRYLIEQRVWKFRRRFEGGSSELSRVERRFGFSGLGWGVRLCERSELSHLTAGSFSEPETLQLAGLISQYLQGRNPAQARELVRRSLFPPSRNLDLDVQQLGESLTGLGIWGRAQFRQALARLPLAGSWLNRERVRVERTQAGSMTLQIAPRMVSLRWFAVLSFWSGVSLSSLKYLAGLNAYQELHYLIRLEPSVVLPTLWGVGVFSIGLGYLAHRLVSSLVSTTISLEGDTYRIRHRLGFFSRSQQGRLSEIQSLALQRRPWRRGGDLIFGSGRTAAHWLRPQDRILLLEALSEHVAAQKLRMSIFAEAALDEWREQRSRWQQRAFGAQARVDFDPQQLSLRVKPQGFTGAVLRERSLGLALLLTGLGPTWVVLVMLYGIADIFTSLSPVHALISMALKLAADSAWFLSAQGWHLLSGLGLGLMLHADYRSRHESELSLSEGRIEVRHRYLRWRWQHSLTPGEEQVQTRRRFGKLRLTAAGQKPRRIASGLSEADSALISQEIATWQSLPEDRIAAAGQKEALAAPEPAAASAYNATAETPEKGMVSQDPGQFAHRRFLQRFGEVSRRRRQRIEPVTPLSEPEA